MNNLPPTLFEQLGIPNNDIDKGIEIMVDGINNRYVEYTGINYYCLIQYVGDYRNTNIIHKEISPGLY